MMSKLSEKRDDEDEVRTRPLSFSLIRRLFGSLGGYIWFMLLANLACFICVAADLYIVREVGALVEREDLFTATALSLFAPLALICLSNRFFGFFQFALTLWVSNKAITNLRLHFYQRLQHLSKRFFDEHKTGWLVARSTGDLATIGDFLSYSLMMSILLITLFTFALFFMLSTSPRLVLVSAVTVPLMVILMKWFKKRMSDAQREYREQNSSMVGYLAETIKGIKVVQAFNREDINLNMYQDLNEENCSLGIRAARLIAFFMPTFDALALISIAVIMLTSGYLISIGYTTLDGQPLGPATLIPFIFYTVMMQNQVRMAIDLYNLSISAMASAERVFEIIDMDPELTDPAHPHPPDCISAQISFNDLSFRYNQSTPWVLQGINLNIAANETVALVGKTGSGKTTMAHLIGRFYDPVEGSITLDGIDLKDFNQNELHKRMGIVLQDGFLFSGSVMDNIRFRRSSMSDAEVMAVCRQLGTYDAISQLPNGFNTPVYEGGASMSVGQRQILSLSRGLAADPKILILDEATSAIDVQTERVLDRALDRLRRDRTTIIIAHRLSTIRNADRILVIGNGGIIEEGDHHSLLAKNGHYAKLVKTTV